MFNVERIAARAVEAAFFNVGDIVTFGKYQNKKARIVAFHDDGKGNPLVELEPIPKGRKQNKTIALFKIRHSVNIQKVAARVARFAKEFSAPEALREYLREHPGALTSQRVATRYLMAADDTQDIDRLEKMIANWKEQPLPKAGVEVRDWQFKPR